MSLDNTPHPRVLHIASGDLWAGAEVQLFTLAKTSHMQLAIPTNIVLLNHGRLERELHNAGIPVNVLDESRLSVLQILRKLIRTIREQNPDVIHTHRIKENILGSIAAFLAGGVPSLRTVHGAPEHRPSWRQFPKRIIRFLDWLAGRFLQRRIIAVSEDLAIILRKNFPYDKIDVIENGIDVDSVQTNISKQDPAAGTQEKKLRIGLAGRLVPVKRVDLLIETARYLLDHHPHLKPSFHIFGDGPMRNELMRLSRELNTEGIVHFEGHCDDIHQKLQKIDVLLLTSDHEGLPMILLEAMVLQIPIVAHAVGGIPKVMDYGSCGILVQEHCAAGYGDAIYQLVSAPRMRANVTQNGLERVTEYYSAKRNAHDYALIYAAL